MLRNASRAQEAKVLLVLQRRGARHRLEMLEERGTAHAGPRRKVAHHDWPGEVRLDFARGVEDATGRRLVPEQLAKRLGMSAKEKPGVDFPRRDRGQQAARLLVVRVPEIAQKRLLHLEIGLTERDRERVRLPRSTGRRHVDGEAAPEVEVDREDQRCLGPIRRGLGDARNDRQGMAHDKGLPVSGPQGPFTRSHLLGALLHEAQKRAVNGRVLPGRRGKSQEMQAAGAMCERALCRSF